MSYLQTLGFSTGLADFASWTEGPWGDGNGQPKLVLDEELSEDLDLEASVPSERQSKREVRLGKGWRAASRAVHNHGIPDPKFCGSVLVVGEHILRDEGGRGVVSAIAVGGNAAPCGGIAVSILEVEDGCQTHDEAMEDRCGFGSVAAVRGEWRSVLGGADGTFGDCRAAGSDGHSVDGHCGLAETGWTQAFRADSFWSGAGICGNGDTSGAVAHRGIRANGSRRCGSAGGGVAGVGRWIPVEQAWGTAEFAAPWRDDAGAVRGRGAVDFRAVQRRGGQVSPHGDFGAVVDGCGLSICFWIVHRIFGLFVYFEEEYRGAGGNLRVCESPGGPVHRMVAGG